VTAGGNASRASRPQVRRNSIRIAYGIDFEQLYAGLRMPNGPWVSV
jgi:hypothetical protein